MISSSPCHPITLSPYHPVTLSPCHPITLSRRHEVEVRREEAIEVVARLGGAGGAVNGLAERRAAGQANRKLADQLLELVERQALGHLELAHLEVAQQQFALVGRRRL